MVLNMVDGIELPHGRDRAIDYRGHFKLHRYPLEVPKPYPMRPSRDPRIAMPLCVKSMFRPGLERDQLALCLVAGLVVVLVLGPGSDLSEVPVCQGVSRPRWNQSRPWVSSR